MITSITWNEIRLQLIKQLSSLFLLKDEEITMLSRVLQYDDNQQVTRGGLVKERLDYCFKDNPNKYYHRDGETYFNPYQSAQYTIFLYMLSNQIFKDYGRCMLADKVYYLNKALNGLDLFYEIELPKVFRCDHPVGTVIGRATFGENFSFQQNCTIGNNKGIYPTIGSHVRLCTGAYIIGNCHIGDHVIIGANSGVKDEDIPANSLVFGHSPNLVIKPRKGSA